MNELGNILGGQSGWGCLCSLLAPVAILFVAGIVRLWLYPAKEEGQE